MSDHAAGSASPRTVKVLAMGVAMHAEQALLRDLEDVADLPEGSVVAGHGLMDCDLLVVRDDSAMRHVARRMLTGHPSVRLWILGADGSLSDGQSAASTLLGKPIVRGIVRGLSGAPPAPSAAPVPPPCPVVPPAPDEVPESVPLAQAIRDRVHLSRGQVALVHDTPLVLLDFDRRIAVVASAEPMPQPGAALASVFHGIRMDRVDAATFEARINAQPVLPLIPLLWSVALQAGPMHALLPPLTPASVISLRQWPDFRALAHRHDHFRLCSLLLKRPSTAAEACALLDLEPDTVHGFFNAAYVSGYAVVADTVRASSAPAPARQGHDGGSRLARMWRSMRDRIRA